MKNLPEVGYLRLPEVLKIIPVSKSTWWAGIKTGIYPSPKKLSAKTSAWCVSDIKNLIIDIENGLEAKNENQ